MTGRLGWTWDRWMLYAKGGAAWAGDKYSADIPRFDEHILASQTRAGWTVGGGVEWAFWQNWSAKVEYDFYDFGTRDVSFTGTIFGVPEVVPGQRQTDHLHREVRRQLSLWSDSRSVLIGVFRPLSSIVLVAAIHFYR